MAAAKTWYQKALRKLEKRWVQVLVICLGGAVAIAASAALLAPDVSAAGKAKNKARFRFLHCDQCKLELPYSDDLDGKRCPKCQPPKTGFFIPTETSVKAGSGDSSPWRWYNLAITLEAFATVGAVVYLLYLPVADPATTFYVFTCPHCNQKLRFRRTALGGLGQCRRCKRPFRFPSEDDAELESAVLAREARELAEADHD